MRIMKKSLSAIIAGFGCFACANTYAASPVPTSFNPYLYVGGQVGWANSNWSNFTNLNADDTGTAYGAKIGYQASRRLGAEFGGFILPSSNQNGTINNVNLSGSVDSWVGYGAMTFRFPFFKDESLFLRGKAGVAYRNLDHSGNLYAGVGNGNYWTGILGASLNYGFATRVPVFIGIEYSNIFGSSENWQNSNGSINQNAAPSVQIVAATLSFGLTI